MNAGSEIYSVFMSSRMAITLLASIGLHVAVLTLTQGSLFRPPGTRVEGIAMPPIAIEVSIHPPELRPNHEVPADVKPPGPDLPALAPAPADAPRLLTPLPIPIEQIGTEHPPVAPVVGINATHYFPTSALTVRPKPTSEPDIQLPNGWLEAFGQAKLNLYVSATGEVDSVSLLRTKLAPELHDAVREAFKRLHFSPGEIGGRPVPSVMTIEADISVSLGNRH